MYVGEISLSLTYCLGRRLIIQRVSSSSVMVGGKEISRIGRGLLVFVGICKGDVEADAQFW